MGGGLIQIDFPTSRAASFILLARTQCSQGGQAQDRNPSKRDLGLDERLILSFHNGHGDRNVLLGSDREILVLVLRLLGNGREIKLLLLGRVASGLDQGLSLGSVVTHVLLGDLGSLLRVPLNHGAELRGLRRENLTGLVELLVDELLVGDVDEGHEKDDSGCEQGETPVGHNLDKVVGDESSHGGLSFVSSSPGQSSPELGSRSCGRTHSSRDRDVLSKQDALRLDNEKVDELSGITNQIVQCLPGDSVVLPRAELGRKAIVQKSLARDLGRDGDGEDHPGELEAISEQVEVSNREDERDDRGIGKGRST